MPNLHSANDLYEIDCRGLRCPAPILKIAETARRLKGQHVELLVQATDDDFPTDVEAWCRTSRSTLVEMRHEKDGLYLARVRLPGTTPVPSYTPSSVPSLRGMTAQKVVLEVCKRVASGDTSFEITSDAPGVEGRLRALAASLDASVRTLQRNGDVLTVKITLGDAMPELKGLLEVSSPNTTSAQDRTTLLVMSNDLEKLLAALMLANASAAQGVKVEVFFAFWAIHALRAESPRATTEPREVGVAQKLLKRFVPAGATRQHVGRLHFGGVGTWLLNRLMKDQNVMTLDQHLQATVNHGVELVVCTMSMNLMGLQERDIIELPNIRFAGVTSFAEKARQSSASLVF